MNQHETKPAMIGRLEAAKFLGIGARTLDREVKEGTVPTTKIRGRLLFNVEKLRRWAEAQCEIVEAK